MPEGRRALAGRGDPAARRRRTCSVEPSSSSRSRIPAPSSARIPTAATAVAKGSVVIIRISQGQQLFDVPNVIGNDQGTAEATLERCRVRGRCAEFVESDTDAGIVIDQTPNGGQAPKGHDGHDRRLDRPARADDGLRAESRSGLDEATRLGTDQRRRLQRRGRSRSRRSTRGGRDRARPGSRRGHGARARRRRSRSVRSPASVRAVTGARSRVAVLSGGRSSEHEISVASARAVVDGLREAGYEPVPIEISRDGRWALPGRAPAALEGGRRRAPPAPGADRDDEPRRGARRGRRRLPRPARPVRRGRDGSGPARARGRRLRRRRASPRRRSRWTRTCSRRSCAATASPSPRASRCTPATGIAARIRSATPSSSSLRGSARASASRSSARGEELGAALDLAFAHDDKVARRGVRRGPRGRVQRARQRGPDRIGRRRDRAAQGRLVRLRVEVRRGRDGAGRPGPHRRREQAGRVQELAVRAFLACDCEGMARVDLFVREDGEVLVNELNTIPGFTADERLREAVRGLRDSLRGAAAAARRARPRPQRAPWATAVLTRPSVA